MAKPHQLRIWTCRSCAVPEAAPSLLKLLSLGLRLWELEKTMKPLEIEAMRAVLETLDEPITDPIIDQAREILTKHERQRSSTG